jgi:protein SCO1/2
MKTKIFFLLVIVIAAGAIASSLALTHRHSGKAGVTEAAATTRTFQVNGRVREITPATKTVRVAHEEIPNYMPAMTMPLQVRDASLLNGLRPGDEIHFELSVTESDSWISHLEKVSEGNAASVSASVSAPSSELQKGEQVPDFTLTDENGKPVRLSDFRGKAVVLTFIYTRCPLPNFCPLMSKNFQALQERLSKAFPGKYHLLSVSIDPKFDTPEVLKGYAGLYHADSQSWTFATGTEEQINELASSFGLVREPEGGMISHNLRTALISPDGHLAHLWKSNVWTPYEVHRMIEDSVFHSTTVANAAGAGRFDRTRQN